MNMLGTFKPQKQQAGLTAVLILLCGIFGVSSENFLATPTFISIANQIPDLTLVAVGMTFVLVIGGIDLSTGSTLALSSAVFGVLLTEHDWTLFPASIACIATGSLCGLANGFISIKARIPSFIVTLGMLEIARGATKVVTQSQTKYIGSITDPISDPLPVLSVSPAFLVAVFAVIAGQFVLSKTVFGRYCIAVGTNEEAVIMSGVRIAPYQIMAFCVCGALCGIAGLTHAAKLSTADPNAAIGMELSAIAACVIGGTSLMGGRGNVISTFLGVLIISVLQTGLAQLGVSEPMKQVTTGSVIIIAVLSDALRRRWSSNG